jgi:hypothetical protein
MTVRLEKMYREAAASLREILSSADKVAITTDAWTALTTESYVTVTVHFFSDWVLQSAILQTRSMPERHTAENMAHVLQAAVDHWGIAGKVAACVHDNASNILLANSRYLEWESHRCFAHTLQLAINDGFKLGSVSTVVGGASRLVSHFHHSTVATEALKGKQAEQNLPQHRLIQHVKTRWNSIYDMFERLLEQRWALAAVLSDRGFTKLTDARTLELADASWHVMEELLPVLKSLKCATTALCGETELSISMVHPITATLLSRYLRPTEGESPKVREFKGKVAESLSSRIEPENTDTAQKAALVASFLDPRNKNLRFTTDEVRAAVHTKVQSPGLTTRSSRGAGSRTDPRKKSQTCRCHAGLFRRRVLHGGANHNCSVRIGAIPVRREHLPHTRPCSLVETS